MLLNHPLGKTFDHILCPRHNCVPYGLTSNIAYRRTTVRLRNVWNTQNKKEWFINQ